VAVRGDRYRADPGCEYYGPTQHAGGLYWQILRLLGYPAPVTAEELARAVDRLVDQVAHWSTARWSAPSVQGGTRADAAHALAQRLADLEARASGRPPRPVPRLPTDLALPDQWRVLARDLADADPEPEVVAAGARELLRTRAALFPGS
jgi:hypothetical protein